MANEKVFADIMKELSPFDTKYFFIVLGVMVFLISVAMPINEYFGVSIKSRTDFLSVKHRVLIDACFFMTMITNLYMLLKYKINGLSRVLKKQVFDAIKLVDMKQKEKTGNSIKNYYRQFYLMYIIMFLCIFFVPASDSARYAGIYSGSIYSIYGYVLFFYIFFICLTLLIVWTHEINNYIKRCK